MIQWSKSNLCQISSLKLLKHPYLPICNFGPFFCQKLNIYLLELDFQNHQFSFAIELFRLKLLYLSNKMSETLELVLVINNTKTCLPLKPKLLTLKTNLWRSSHAYVIILHHSSVLSWNHHHYHYTTKGLKPSKKGGTNPLPTLKIPHYLPHYLTKMELAAVWQI